VSARSLLTVLLASAVAPLAADALTAVWSAIAVASVQAALDAAGAALHAAVALWLSVAVLSLDEDPPRGRLALYGWRALMARRAARPDGVPMFATRRRAR
jgi:hypothetical protein